MKFDDNSPLQTMDGGRGGCYRAGDNGKNTEPIGEESLCGISSPEAKRT